MDSLKRLYMTKFNFKSYVREITNLKREETDKGEVKVLSQDSNERTTKTIPFYAGIWVPAESMPSFTIRAKLFGAHKRHRRTPQG